jgi:opacity protein-like surface antigen
MNKGSKIIIGVVGIGVAALATQSMAAQFYGIAGVTYGQTLFHKDLSSPSMTKGNLDNQGAGFALGLGYKISDELSIEMAYRKNHDVNNNTSDKLLMEHDNSESVLIKIASPHSVGGFNPYIGVGSQYTRYKADEAFDYKGRTIAVGDHAAWSPLVALGANWSVGKTTVYLGGTYTIQNKDVPAGYAAEGGVNFSA